MSFDSIEANDAFAKKFAFPFKLLSDTDRAIGLAYGACDSKETKSARRIAYLIREGRITHVYENIKDKAAHASQVLADLS